LEGKEMANGKKVYNEICKILDGIDWTYTRHDDDLIISSGIKSEDLPIEFLIAVNDDRNLIQYISKLPFVMPEDKRVDGAVAVAVANYGMINGSFDYDIKDGEIRFRLTQSYIDGTPSAELIRYMIAVSSGMVDNYNDKFFMLAKNMISISDFIAKENA
jgi:hypothetical protein